MLVLKALARLWIDSARYSPSVFLFSLSSLWLLISLFCLLWGCRCSFPLIFHSVSPLDVRESVVGVAWGVRDRESREESMLRNSSNSTLLTVRAVTAATALWTCLSVAETSLNSSFKISQCNSERPQIHFALEFTYLVSIAPSIEHILTCI